MKRNLLLVLTLCLSYGVAFSQTTVTGKVVDPATQEPIAGASVTLKGKVTSTVTDAAGNFRLVTTAKPPFTLTLYGTGYDRQDVAVTSAEALTVTLVPKSELLNEVVFSASRVEENILQSPVSIEKMDTRTIRETPSMSFYDGLQNLKSVEMVTSGLTFQQINTRGFNHTGNARFLQLVDGVDNQTPGLNFSLGNMFGSSDLDMESAELIPGAASALYGPVAFNGVLMMRTKDPFRYQGLSVQTKLGVNHVNDPYADPHPLYDFAVRYAKAFNNRFAFKVNASYFTGLDWYATNYTDVDPNTPAEARGANNPARNGLNLYGDDEARQVNGVGRVARTGYEEKDLIDYDVYSLKLNGALHYRIAENVEAIYQYNYGQGTASYTGSNRFSINNFTLQQHRAEVRGANYFIRAYATLENSHDSYNARGLGQLMNKTWVQDLNGNVVSEADADNMWYNRYTQAYMGSIPGVAAQSHQGARSFADLGRYMPGSAQFNAQKDRLTAIQGLNGAGILSLSKLYHAEGQYDLSQHVKVMDVLVGGNFRMFDMYTNGTLFDDKDHKIRVSEGGAFVQLSKRLLKEKLKLTASARYDKNQNFDGRITPRASAVYSVTGDHHLRTSFQTGFRNPTPVDQYIKLNAGPITILGGAMDNIAGTGAYDNTYAATSVDPFFNAYYGALAGGASPDQALLAAKDRLVKSNVAYLKPERIKAFEIGYKGFWANTLIVDVNYYFSSYRDFLLNQVVMQPQSPVLAADGSVNVDAAADLVAGRRHAFQLYTNAADRVTSQGATLGLTFLLPRGYTLGANGTWATFDLHNANPNDIPAFNTPTYRSTVTASNNAVTKNVGFSVAWRWQDAFDWTGTFNQLRPGRVDAYSIVDAQVSYKVIPMKTTIKLGANNLLNNRVYQAFGSPTVGGVYYISLTFNQL